MVPPSGRRGDTDLGPVTDRTGRVEGRPVTASSRGVRGRHSTSDLPVTPTPLAPGFHHGTVYDPYLHALTIVQPRISYRSAIQEPIWEFRGQPRQIGVEFFYQILGTAPQDSSCSTHGYSHAEYGVSSSDPYVPGPVDRVFEGDRVVGKEQERRGDDDGDGGDDDQDDGDDDGDEEQTVYVAPVALASGSDGSPRHGKGNVSRVITKDTEVARDVPALTQKRKKAKASNWEQTKTAERGLLTLSSSHHTMDMWRVRYGVDRHLSLC
ncbi:hypothetical protein M9H77_12518 [Catharanthus roseus]|uniref:Uncharacterized protein n=1 Tax=Catharanthus roseus TaxID=4058 RepID=A0ACC0BHJ8_CATRO|nr:hypothetical protein M9H77_12518 [Catharanthus roseus]